MTYAILHFNRESWSILKLKIQNMDGVSSTSLGAMDTSFLALYSIGLFVSGALGDHLNPKWLLVISFCLVTVITAVIAICGMQNWMNVFFFSFLFALNGCVQSVGWPCVNSIFANWFGKKGRGTLIGFWQSCANFGNVAGALLTSFFTSTIGMTWELTYLVMGCFCLGIAIINAFLLVVHPEERGIVIEEIDRRMSNVEEKLRRESLKKGEIS
jgi:sugar phosphate permease